MSFGVVRCFRIQVFCKVFGFWVKNDIVVAWKNVDVQDTGLVKGKVFDLRGHHVKRMMDVCVKWGMVCKMGNGKSSLCCDTGHGFWP